MPAAVEIKQAPFEEEEDIIVQNDQNEEMQPEEREIVEVEMNH